MGVARVGHRDVPRHLADVGAAVVLVPISLGLAVLAVRCSPDALRNLVVTLGLAVNGLLAVLFLATVAIVRYDAFVG